MICVTFYIYNVVKTFESGVGRGGRCGGNTVFINSTNGVAVMLEWVSQIVLDSNKRERVQAFFWEDRWYLYTNFVVFVVLGYYVVCIYLHGLLTRFCGWCTDTRFVCLSMSLNSRENDKRRRSNQLEKNRLTTIITDQTREALRANWFEVNHWMVIKLSINWPNPKRSSDLWHLRCVFKRGIFKLNIYKYFIEKWCMEI